MMSKAVYSQESLKLRKDCEAIVSYAIKRVQPAQAVARALKDKKFSGGRLILAAVGKAAWSMARAAWDCLERKPDAGIVITKYHHNKGDIGNLEIWEAGHPIPDENSVRATERVLQLTANLKEDDTVLFLLSGGGSALFELPVIPLRQIQDVTAQMLKVGADIVEINTIRKRLSHVKGGRFARHCAPARMFSVVLSDVIGDKLDMIASGPASPDPSTSEQAIKLAKKYALGFTPRIMAALEAETPKELDNVETVIIGSVRELCSAAMEKCRELGYNTLFLSDCVTCEAREAGSFLASVACSYQNVTEPLAIIMGGETVVHLTGSGKGGRNQELALSAALHISKLDRTAVFSIGSDGTDGPTDAAGGFVTNETFSILEEKGISIVEALQNNDAYTALSACDALIVTGATGTNVNDLSVALIDR